jgi:hypothetical protein
MRTISSGSTATTNLVNGIGLNDEKDPHTKERYEFPYGDFVDVHRCAVLSAESRAGQYKHYEIENAAAHLHGMIDTSQH